jgi:murein DD-endopeptidase MepM/ murein hydrolase activator NlpD
MILTAALALSACTTSPRTQLAWDVRDHRIAAHHPRTAYGPGAVALPPVERQRFVPPEQQYDDSVPQPTPKPRAAPGWYASTAKAEQYAPREAASYSDRVADTPPKFHWPISGRVVSTFGENGSGERNDGINIAAARGTPVRASAAGTVSYCGNELKGYGNLVLIRHDNGYITAYAHVDNFIVNRDDHVASGQVIAYSGATGDVTTPQLHFEIRRGVRPIDPKRLLPDSLVVASN